MRHFSTPDEDEIAAALAAVCCYVEQEQGDSHAEPPRMSAWRRAGVLEAMGQPPAHSRTASAWSSADRAARAHRWSYGIIDL